MFWNIYAFICHKTHFILKELFVISYIIKNYIASENLSVLDPSQKMLYCYNSQPSDSFHNSLRIISETQRNGVAYAAFVPVQTTCTSVLVPSTVTCT
jgi:hypothetical protein